MTTGHPMTDTDPMTRSGARWCDKHDRWECNANIGNHHANAIRGQAKCKNCVGKTTAVAKAEGKANLAAWSLEFAAGLGAVNLHERMLALIHLTAARHGIYAEQLRLQHAADSAGGLIGATWVVGRGGEGVQSGEQMRGLVKLEFEERKFLAHLLERAHAMGISTQALELAQGHAQIVVVAFRAAVEAAGAELIPAVRMVMTAAFLGALESSVELPAGSSSLVGVVAEEVAGK